MCCCWQAGTLEVGALLPVPCLQRSCCLSRGSLWMEQVPAGTTVGDLVSGLVPGAGAAFTPAHAAASSRRAALRVLVNHQESDDMAACLTSGDQVAVGPPQCLLTVSE